MLDMQHELVAMLATARAVFMATGKAHIDARAAYDNAKDAVDRIEKEIHQRYLDAVRKIGHADA